MTTFDLSTPQGWPALGAAYRIAHEADLAAVDAFCAAESAAMDDPEHRDVAPHETHNDSVARMDHNKTIAARHGVERLSEEQSRASDARWEYVHAALNTPAPDLAAVSLKLEMICDEGGWNDFDNESWAIFVEDLQRVCGVSIPAGAKEARQ